jgi:hypothetical protein
MHVACAAERNYLGHSAAMLHSVLANADGLEVEVHYMHGGDIRRRDDRGTSDEGLHAQGHLVPGPAAGDAA